MKLRYDKNTGETARLDDYVEICHTNSDMDGYKGLIGGWYGIDREIALVILDNCFPSGETAVAIPVVCLRTAR